MFAIDGVTVSTGTTTLILNAGTCSRARYTHTAVCSSSGICVRNCLSIFTLKLRLNGATSVEYCYSFGAQASLASGADFVDKKVYECFAKSGCQHDDMMGWQASRNF